MFWIIFIAIILIFIIAFSYGVNKDKKKEQEDRARKIAERRDKITQQPISKEERNARRYSSANNRTNFQSESTLNSDLEEKTRWYYSDIGSENEEKSVYQILPDTPSVSSTTITDQTTLFDIYLKDNWGEFEDYSYLTPSQARHELRKRKEDEGYVPWEEYIGYIEVIASEKDDKYLDIIQSKTPEELEQWFHKNIRNDVKMSQLIWKEVSKILAPIHEAYLLDKMEHCSERSIESFVKNRKSEGYFFSQKAYDIANDIYYGRYNPIQLRKEQNKPILSIKRSISKYQKLYDEAAKAGDMDAMGKAKLKLKEFQKRLDELTEK